MYPFGLLLEEDIDENSTAIAKDPSISYFY